MIEADGGTCNDDGPHEDAPGPAQRPLVCARRPARLRSSLARHADGLWAGGLGRQAGIAILNTWSEAQPCHMHFKSRVDDVKRGILQAGGFPMELPALSLSES